MKKLFKYIKPYRGLVLLVVVLTAVQSISQLYLPNLMSQIVDEGVVGEDIGLIIRIGLLMVFVTLLVSISTIIARFFAARIALAFTKDLRLDIFKKVESFSLDEFDKIGTSSLITRTTNDVTQIQNVLVMILTMLIMAPLTMIGGLFMALSQDVPLSGIVLVAVIFLGILIGFISVFGVPLFKSLQVKLDELNRVLREGLTGIRVIRAFNKETYEEQRFEEHNRDLTDVSIKVFRITGVMMPAILLIMNLSTVAIIWFGGFRIDSGAMGVGDLMAFQQYVMQIMFSLIMATIMFVMIPRASASAERINEILDMELSIVNKEGSNPQTTEVGVLTFDNVSFRHNGAEEKALEGVSFKALPNETTAVIGGTGSGKSTLIKLIPRFYDVTDGCILVDGIDIREFDEHTLRNKIGYIPQKVNLFNGSIRDNIKFGKEDATDEEIYKALEMAQALDFVNELEKGLDSVVSQGGKNFSGGQKQRLSIARALVRQPEIYIFDDSFSALDFKTDAKLRQTLNDEIDNATIIIVAQRVSTVMKADRIIVLDEGKVVGFGTHKELMKSCEVYQEIVASQLSEEELA